MQVVRLATLALAVVALSALSGCRTAGVSDLVRSNPPLPSSAASATAILAEHNRNAERVQVLQAKPDLTLTVHDRARRDASHPLSGRLALEQPRNFKLELYHAAMPGAVGDLGSNDTEYWFWFNDRTQNRSQKALYYCNYDEADANPQAAVFQPDWIKEAMGLRVIPESEAADITVTAGESGTLVLTHRPHRAGGKTYSRVTIVDKSTHLIREHQLRTGDRKTLLARAEVPEGYLRLAVPAEPGSTAQETVLIPKRLKLSWIQEGFDLDATFRERDIRINRPLNQAMRAELFVEPQLGKDYARVNLAENAQASAGPTTIRESRPVPPSGSGSGGVSGASSRGTGTSTSTSTSSGGIRLRAPAPIEDDAAATEGTSHSDSDRGSSLALSGDEPAVPSLTDQVVGERFPAAPEPAYLKPEGSSGWRAATSSGLVRE
jgi:hypothetical protein